VGGWRKIECFFPSSLFSSPAHNRQMTRRIFLPYFPFVDSKHLESFLCNFSSQTRVLAPKRIIYFHVTHTTHFLSPLKMIYFYDAKLININKHQIMLERKMPDN
jgi:hypothetical protein